MKVLIIGRGKPDSVYPLNGSFEYDQAIALAASGLDVTYFAVDLRSIRRKRKFGIIHGDNDGVRWHVINVPVGAFPLSWLCIIGKMALKLLFNIVFKEQSNYPDVIHAHFMAMGNIAASLSKATKIPLVITEHSSAINDENVKHSVIKCAKEGYSQASQVIAVSQHLANNIFKHTGIKACVIPNMINVEVFENSERKPHQPFHLVSTGGLISSKGFANLIRAFGKIAIDHDDLYLHIIGDGYMRNELEILATELGVKERVTFHGYRNLSEIAEIYGVCDCFVLVSSTETFGVVYVEAMAAGLPVIATRCGGPEGFVNENNGILVDVDNDEQLCDAIMWMRNNYHIYSERQLKKFVRENYAPEIISKKLSNIYTEVKNG